MVDTVLQKENPLQKQRLYLKPLSKLNIQSCSYRNIQPAMFLVYSSPTSSFAAVAQGIQECHYFILVLRIVQHKLDDFPQFVTENMPMSKSLCDLLLAASTSSYSDIFRA